MEAVLHEQGCKNVRDREIKGVDSLEEADPCKISFLINRQYLPFAEKTKAAAIIVDQKIDDLPIPQIVHPQAYVLLAKIASKFIQTHHEYTKQSELAYISPKAYVANDAIIFPFVYVAHGAYINSKVILYPHVYVGEKASIGKRSILKPHVTVMNHVQIGADVVIHGGSVIGADGFGFAVDKEQIHKIPQKGSVTLENKVEVGALTTIDCATFQMTKICEGCKLDSQVHVAHNVEIGKNSILCGHTAIAGSVKIGNHATIGGGVGIAPNLTIGDHVTLAGRSAVTRHLEENKTYQGYPAVPINEWRRMIAAQKKLPKLIKKVSALQKKLDLLEEKVCSTDGNHS